MPDAFQIVNGPEDPRAVVLRVCGHLDSTSAPELARRCAEVGHSGRDLVLNLGQVDFIASSGVGALLAIADQLHAADRTLQLAALSPAVDAVIRLLNLDQFLAIHATEGEALATKRAA